MMKPDNYLFLQVLFVVFCFFNEESFFPNARMQFHGSLSQFKSCLLLFSASSHSLSVQKRCFCASTGT